jgi:hypothetical protein
MSKRPIGRPKTLWEDDVLGDIRRLNVNNWKKLEKVVQDRDRRKEVAERARTLHGLQRFKREREQIKRTSVENGSPS